MIRETYLNSPKPRDSVPISPFGQDKPAPTPVSWRPVIIAGILGVSLVSAANILHSPQPAPIAAPREQVAVPTPTPSSTPRPTPVPLQVTPVIPPAILPDPPAILPDPPAILPDPPAILPDPVVRRAQAVPTPAVRRGELVGLPINTLWRVTMPCDGQRIIINYKGEVPTFGDLPRNPGLNDMYKVTEAGGNSWVWYQLNNFRAPAWVDP